KRDEQRPCQQGACLTPHPLAGPAYRPPRGNRLCTHARALRRRSSCMPAAFRSRHLLLSTEHGQPEDSLLAELTAVELAYDVAGAHDKDSIAHRDDFRQLRRDQQDAASPRHEFIDQVVDLVFGPYVDAPSTFV